MRENLEQPKQPEKVSNRELIQSVANSHGYHFKPKYYIRFLQEYYNVLVDNSEVTKAIGKFSDRKGSTPSFVNRLADQFLSTCGNDSSTAISIIKGRINENN